MMLRLAAFACVLLAAYPCVAQSDTAKAGSPEDFFNRASRQYVREDKGSALRILDQGLRAHPGDPRMLKLAEALLKEDQNKQQQQQQQQQQQEQQQQQDKQQQQQQQAKQEQKEQREQGQEQAPDQPRDGNGLSKRDAERILDELNRGEQDVQEKARSRMRPGHKTTTDKDW